MRGTRAKPGSRHRSREKSVFVTPLTADILRIAYVLRIRIEAVGALHIAYCVSVFRIEAVGSVLHIVSILCICIANCVLRIRIAYCVSVLRIRIAYCVLRIRIAYCVLRIACIAYTYISLNVPASGLLLLFSGSGMLPGDLFFDTNFTKYDGTRIPDGI